MARRYLCGRSSSWICWRKSSNFPRYLEQAAPGSFSHSFELRRWYSLGTHTHTGEREWGAGGSRGGMSPRLRSRRKSRVQTSFPELSSATINSMKKRKSRGNVNLVRKKIVSPSPRHSVKRRCTRGGFPFFQKKKKKEIEPATGVRKGLVTKIWRLKIM